MSSTSHRPSMTTSRSWRMLALTGNRIQAIHPKWLEHHQSGHDDLTKDKNCPVCMEEAGSRVAHWRNKGDRQPGVMHVDLAAFEASTDGNKYCLVAAVTTRSPSCYQSLFQCRRRTQSVHLLPSQKL